MNNDSFNQYHISININIIFITYLYLNVIVYFAIYTLRLVCISLPNARGKISYKILINHCFSMNNESWIGS